MSELDGSLIAVSISDAPDRARLGFPKREIDRALLTLCTALIREGAVIGYGGNLDPEGFTFKIFRHLAGAYAGSREAFRHFIPEPVARVTRYEVLLSALNEGRATVRTEIARGNEFVLARPREGGIRLGENGLVRSDAELVAWFSESPPLDPRAAHTTAREMVAELADARIILGGKMGILAEPRDAYEGAMPGIAEEAIMTLERGKPLIALGAFGGVSRDIAIALRLIDEDSRVPRTEQHPTYQPAMERIAELRDRIPEALLVQLKALAADDRAEQLGFQAVKLIQHWGGMIAAGG